MSNKTALQELLEWMDSEGYSLSELESYILSHRKEFLEKERQQLMEAFKKGVTSCYDFKTPEQYFNSNYGNPQGDQETTNKLQR